MIRELSTQSNKAIDDPKAACAGVMNCQLDEQGYSGKASEQIDLQAQAASEGRNEHLIVDAIAEIINRSILSEPSELQRWVDRVNGYDGGHVKHHLFEVIEQSKTDSTYAIGAANAITILNLASVSFSHRDFKHVRVSGADLAGSILYKTDFSGADLRGVDLRGACIVQTTFNGAMMDEACFGKRTSIRAHESSVLSIDLSSDGQCLASASKDKTLRLWNISSRETLSILRHPTMVFSVAFSPDGHRIASACDDHKVRLYDVASNHLIYNYVGHSASVWCVAYHPTRPILVSGSLDTTIRLWSTENGSSQGVLIGHKWSVYELAISADGQTLASTGCDGDIRLWSFETKACTHCFPLPGSGTIGLSLSISPDNQALASGDNSGSVFIWFLSEAQQVNQLSGHTGSVYSVSYSPTGDLLATGSKDKSIRLWHPRSGNCISVFEGHGDYVNSLSFHPNGEWLLSGSRDKTIRYWYLNGLRRELRGRFHRHVIRCMSISSKGYLVIMSTGGANASATVVVRDLSGGGEVYRASDIVGINHVTFSPSGQLLFYNRYSSVESYDLTRSSLVRCYLPPFKSYGYNPVESIVISPCERYVFGLYREGHLVQWSFNDGNALNSLMGRGTYSTPPFSSFGRLSISPLSGLLCVSNEDGYFNTYRYAHEALTLASEDIVKAHSRIHACSLNNAYLALATHHGVILVTSMETGCLVVELSGHAKCITDMSFSVDDRLLGSSSEDCTIRVWQVGSWECLAALTAFSAPVRAIAFGVENKFLYSGGDERMVYCWDIKALSLEEGDDALSSGVRLVSRDGDQLTMINSVCDEVEGLSKQHAALFNEQNVPIQENKDNEYAKASEYIVGEQVWKKPSQCYIM